jgi:hypothetical protein
VGGFYTLYDWGKSEVRKKKKGRFIPKTKAIKGFWVSPPSLPWRQKRFHQ